MAALKQTFRQPGVVRAALGYFRAMSGLLLVEWLTGHPG